MFCFNQFDNTNVYHRDLQNKYISLKNHLIFNFNIFGDFDINLSNIDISCHN